jgi:hypothetical protein
MADPTIAIGNHILKFKLPSTAKIVMLQELSTGAGIGAATDRATNTTYQVPAGKKFWMLYVMWDHGNTSENAIIWDHTVPSVAGGVIALDMDAAGASPNSLPRRNYDVFYSFAAAKYVNVQNAAANQSAITIIGVELDV